MERGRLGVFGTVLAFGPLCRLALSRIAFTGLEWGAYLSLILYGYLHGGAAVASAMALVQLIPAALLAPVLAAAGGRRRPGRVLLVAYLGLAAALALIGAAMLLDAPRWVVFVLAPLVGVGITVPRPAEAALLPALARTPGELTAANVVSGWMSSVSALAAPALTGVLIGLGGPGLAMVVLSTAILGAAIAVAPLPGSAPPAPASSEGARTHIGKEIRQIRRNPAASLLVGVLAVQYILVGALDLLYVVLAVTVLGMGESGAGYLNAAFGAGAFIGASLTALLVARRRLAPALVGGILTAALALGILGLFPTVLTAFALIGLAGVGRTVFDVTGRILLQRAVPPALLVQVFALIESLMSVGLAIGAVVVPVLVGLSGARAALVGTGLLFVVLIGVMWRRLWRMDEAADVPQVEIHLLRSVSIFAPLPAPALEGLARALVPITAAPGEVVMAEGEPGDRFYVVARGEVEVTLAGRHVATLRHGDGFGEIALLRDVPRTATVTATVPTDLYALEKVPFLIALTGYAPAGTAADEMMDRRMRELEGVR
jgi:hypothetical protein